MSFPLPTTAAVDVALAARRYLASLAEIRAVLGPTGADSADTVWLFLRELSVLVEGSSRTAAVLRVDGGWTRPNTHNTAHFPRLRLEIYSDCSRSGVTIVRRDAEARAWHAWAAFDRILHRAVAFSEIWGAGPGDPGCRVWGSQLQSHPDVFPVSEWDGGTRLLAYYGLSVG